MYTMQEMQVVIILLSIIVTMLSVMVLVLIGAMIALFIKFRKIVQRVDTITTNVVSATEWLSPTKVFSEVAHLFRKR